MAAETSSRPAQRARAVRVDRARTLRLAAIAGAIALVLGVALGFTVARMAAQSGTAPASTSR